MSQFQILARRPFPFKAIPIRFAYTNFPDTILSLVQPRLKQYGMEFPNLYKILIVFGKDDIRNVKLWNGKAVFFKFRNEFLAQL